MDTRHLLTLTWHPGREETVGAAFGSAAVLATTVSAHGGAETGGPPVTFAVVVGLPVLAGLLGGLVAARRRAAHPPAGSSRRGLAFGLLPVVLGATFGLAALSTSLRVASVGGGVGMAAAAWTLRGGRTRPDDRAHHAHLTFGAVGAHRLFEGVVVGVLYRTGAVVGLVGAVTLAVHTAVETAAVGGLFGAHRVRTVGAIVLVQASYAGGAVAGGVVSRTIPESIGVAVLGLTGGVLVVSGLSEVWRAVTAGDTPDPRRDAGV